MIKFFIGIDFSKETFDATLIREGELDSQGEHSVFKNTSEGAESLLSWIACQNGGADKELYLFCGEDTGLYSREVSDALSRKGYFVWLDSALRIKRSLGLSRGKNDRKDSHEIALYAARFRDRARQYTIPDKAEDTLKVLFSRRKFLVGQLGALRRRSREMRAVLRGNASLSRSFRSDDKIVGVFRAEIKSVEKEMRRVIASSPELEQTFSILTSMKGIALVNAVALIVYTSNFRKFDYDPRRIASFWGVAPFAQVSGSSLNRTPHVSHLADKYLKSLLSEAALCAMRYCPKIRDYAQGLIDRGKHPSIVKNNVKNKILHILVAMVRDKKVFVDAA